MHIDHGDVRVAMPGLQKANLKKRMEFMAAPSGKSWTSRVFFGPSAPAPLGWLTLMIIMMCWLSVLTQGMWLGSVATLLFAFWAKSLWPRLTSCRKPPLLPLTHGLDLDQVDSNSAWLNITLNRMISWRNLHVRGPAGFVRAQLFVPSTLSDSMSGSTPPLPLHIFSR